MTNLTHLVLGFNLVSLFDRESYELYIKITGAIFFEVACLGFWRAFAFVGYMHRDPLKEMLVNVGSILRWVGVSAATKYLMLLDSAAIPACP